jgi:hypothetical protein
MQRRIRRASFKGACKRSKRAGNFFHDVMAGLDPAIKVILKYLHFLLLDGPIKSGHDKRVGWLPGYSLLLQARMISL